MAHRIATMINNAAAFPSGTFNCPADTGVRISLYMHPLGTDRVQKLTLAPTGCATIAADGLRSRALPVALLRTLAPYGPAYALGSYR